MNFHFNLSPATLELIAFTNFSIIETNWLEFDFCVYETQSKVQ